VHVETIREAYQKYCTVTNSNLLGSKALKTVIEDRLNKQLDRNLRINDINRSGYTGLKFDIELFDGTITTLEKARKRGQSVFPVLIEMFPDLENSTNTAKFYTTLQNSTTKTTISNTICRIVEKYSREKTEGNRENNDGSGKNFPRENSAEKNSTNSTTLQDVVTDIEMPVEFCRISVENVEIPVPDSDNQISTVVEEFMADGGRASLKRFLEEFPMARRPEDAAIGL
jgi:hypothetical protein